MEEQFKIGDKFTRNARPFEILIVEYVSKKRITDQWGFEWKKKDCSKCPDSKKPYIITDLKIFY